MKNNRNFGSFDSSSRRRGTRLPIIPIILVLLVVALKQNGDVQTIGLWVTVAVALAWAVWLGSRLISWQTTHFLVTSERLVFRSGILAKHSRDIPLDKINDLESRQTFFERMLGAGDLLIESAGERGQEVFSDIPHPDAVQQEIYRQMEANQDKTARRTQPHFEAPAAAASIPEQIQQLAQLRDLDQGVHAKAACHTGRTLPCLECWSPGRSGARTSLGEVHPT